MANPSPFAPTSNDSVDWVQPVTPVVVQGSSSTTISGGVLQAFSWTQITAATDATHNPAIAATGPTDGNQHYLTSAQLNCTVVGGTLTGTVWVKAFLQDFSRTINFLSVEGILTASGTVSPQFIAESVIAWPGGANIPIQNAGAHQLNVVSQASVLSGTLTFISVEGLCNFSYV